MGGGPPSMGNRMRLLRHMNLECAITAKTQRCRKWAREWVPVDLGFMNGLMSILMAFFLLGFQRRYGIQPFDLSLTSAFFICYSIFTANVVVQLVNLASHRSAPVRIFSNLLLIILFVLLHSYYLITHIPLNCALIIDNFSLGFYKESWYTILGAFPRWLFIILGTGIIILLAIHMKKKILSSPAEYRHPTPKAITAALLYALILLLPVKTYDELTGLLRGIIRYPFQDPMINITIAGYPYLRTFTVTPDLGRPSSAPDIILVMVESYNANVVKKKTPEGKEITPVFNSLIPRGVYVERFYGNSVQTCNGQAAVLLSIIPSIRGKIFTSFPNLSFSALPGILRDAGYETMFVQAARELDFDNTRSFMKKAGFQHIHSAYEFLTDADAPQVWGWGPEDGLFYRLSLRLMDLIRRQCGGRPVFAVLATTSNHMWFDHVPKEKCRIYPDPGDIGQRYADTDPRWKDAPSGQFVREAVALAGRAGMSVGHCDVTIVTEAPKLGPHREAMRQSLAGLLGAPLEAVSVKAKTNEGMGWVGRGEGLAVWAVVTLQAGRA